ncbi:hypothetical protein [Nostoc sp. UHCC 0870]|uniref:hypothetical protein n=1 Tax=Nostoc sp. UHCC 0870 TaxID=2914041 RepID=UPI001EE0F61B|nr:hypothetical protein [Nostoc sp. UHCC 0870]UKO97380.1 hypothetical protein L6494_22815 [Nostoc sp. UHCC 0870]
MKFLKNILKISILLTFITYIQLPPAWADVLPPGESPVSYCFQVANLNKYSNYLLIAQISSQNPSLPTYNRILKQGKCLELNGYREYSDIYAIKKTQLKSGDIIESKDGASIKNLNSKKSLLIPSTNSISSLRLLPDRYGVKEVADILEIVAITPKSLELKYKEVIYNSQIGDSEVKAYQAQDKRPLPSFGNQLNLLNLIIPGISIVGIMLVFRKTKNFKGQN